MEIHTCSRDSFKWLKNQMTHSIIYSVHMEVTKFHSSSRGMHSSTAARGKSNSSSDVNSRRAGASEEYRSPFLG